ncbi:MAG: ATP-binding protein [Micromonosporaceae bacterium]
MDRVAKLTAPTDIVGREAEVSTLRALVAELATGQGAATWIEGEPGIGKSTLVDAVVHEARASGFTVLRGAANELTTPFPLRVAAKCLRVSLHSRELARREIAQLLYGETVVGTFDPVISAAERMLEIVDRLVSSGPVVFVLEDLHWADEASLQLWNRLTYIVGQVPLLLIGTCRPVPIRPVVSRLRATVRERGGTLVGLAPLGKSDVELFASRLVAARPGPRLAGALTRAGGNPLYVRELAQALLLDRQITVTAGEAELRADADTTPTSLTAAITHRLDYLTESTAKVLRLAALLGNEFDIEDLATVTDRTPISLVDAVTEAATAGVIGESGRRVTFRHDLIRQVLVEQTSPGMRIALHSSFARQLVEAGRSPDRVAQHLLAVPDPLDDWAPGWLTSVPESVMFAAPQVSADLLTRAVDALPSDDPRREELACRLVQLLFWLGRDQQVLEMAAVIPRLPADAERAARWSLYLARAAGRTGEYGTVLELLGRALTDERLSAVWRARLTAWLGIAYAYLGRADAEATAQRALADARRCDDALAAGYALHGLQVVSRYTQPEYVEQALDGLGGDPESTDLRMMLEIRRAGSLNAAGESEAAERAVREALVFADRIGTYRSATVVTGAAEISFQHGNWDEALVRLASVAPEFVDTVYIRDGHGIAAVIALRRGEPEQARSHLLAAGVTQPVETFEADHTVPFLTAAVALVAEAAGDLDRTLRLQASWLDLPDGPMRDDLCADTPDLVRTALKLSDVATARAALRTCREARRATAQIALAERCCEAMLDGDASALLAVGADYRACGWIPRAAFALEEAAVRLAEAGQIVPARRALTDAARAYDGLGAAWDIRRADARLRPLGVRRGPRSLHRRSKTGYAALTPSEQRVARLVAEGMSNPDIAAELFLSRNTVQTHVSNILGKLKLRSRLELVREVAARAESPFDASG